MAHGIMENDSGFSANGIRPWHNLPQMKVLAEGEYPTVATALHESGLDWNVVQKQVYAEGGIIIPDTFANIREDTDNVLGVVSKKYKIIQNVEALDFVDNIMGGNLRFESAGSLFGNKKIFLCARMDDREVLGDKYENYLCFSNSFDGKGSIVCCVTPVRVVCNNTLQASIKSASRIWSTRHVGDISAKKKEAIETLGLATKYLDTLEDVANQFVVLRPNWEKFIEDLVPITDDMSERIKNNTINIRDTITKIYKDKDDLQNFRGNAWGMYQAVSDYCSNADPLRKAPTYNDYKMENHMLGEIPMLKKAEKILLCA